MRTLSVIAALFLSFSAQAQIRIPTFQQLCSYEPSCSKVGHVDHNQLQPNLPPEQLFHDYYDHLRPLIIQIARLYKIDPVTLVAAPLAENTMNVRSLKGKVEGFFDGSEDQVDDDGVLTNPVMRAYYDKPLSVGPGQIYVYAAKHVEQLAARIEGRAVRTKGKDIKHALYTPDGALKYAAAIIRDAQDTYAGAGIDISHRPEILATLYNIGKVQDRVRNTISERREVLPNYFGYWVAVNYRYIQQRLQLPSIIDQP